jgi:predicted nucleic acid-binding protein
LIKNLQEDIEMLRKTGFLISDKLGHKILREVGENF